MRTIAAIALLVIFTGCTAQPEAQEAQPPPTKARAPALQAAPASLAGEVVSIDCNVVDCDGGDIVIQPNPGGAVVETGCRRFGPLGAPPAASSECDSYFDTTEHWPCYRNDTAWVKSSDDVTVCT